MFKRILLIGLLTWATTFKVIGQDIHQFHAIFIYSFARYIEWPEMKESDEFVIAVLGDSPIIKHLDHMAKTKKNGNQPFKVIQVAEPDEIEYCHILFIPRNSSQLFETSNETFADKSVLIITDTPGLGELGAGINFVLVNGRPRFELNEQVALDKNLKIAAELLKLAIRI